MLSSMPGSREIVGATIQIAPPEVAVVPPNNAVFSQTRTRMPSMAPTRPALRPAAPVPNTRRSVSSFHSLIENSLRGGNQRAPLDVVAKRRCADSVCGSRVDDVRRGRLYAIAQDAYY